MIKPNYNLLFLQHPYVVPPEYDDNSSFCPSCNTIEFYIICLLCLAIIIIITKIKKINIKYLRKVCYLISYSTLIYLLFFKDFPTICIISGSFGFFLILGMLFLFFYIFI